MSGLQRTESSKGYRLLVQSIGTADAAVIPSLRVLRGATDIELAALLYRAPSELISNVDEATGASLARVLREAGVQVELTPVGEAFEAGVGELEVAIAVKRFDNMLGIVEAAMRVLGVDLETGKRMICQSPGVLIGSISQATASALEQRFAPLGAELDVSKTAVAAFDIAAEGADEATGKILSDLLPGAASVRGSGSSGHFLAAGLGAEAAQSLWSELSRTAAKARILNRDFHRFDVKLEAAEASPEMIDLLRSTTGMSEASAARALGSLPFVLAENVRGAQMVDLLDRVHALGGRATGTLLALMRFGLALKAGGDRAGARPWVEAIGGADAAKDFAQPSCGELRGPMTKTAARWLQHELRKYGVFSHLVER